MLANMSGVEELLLSNEEAEQLADAAKRVEALYRADWLSEEAAAWINLVMVAGSVYGPRYIAIRARQRREESKGPITIEPLSVAAAN